MLASLAACGPQAPTDSTTAPAAPAVPDGHTSRNSLDWAGTYQGLLPCADCAGLLTTLRLDTAGTYALTTRRLGAGEASLGREGTFTWSADGGSISLPSEAEPSAFRVGEGRLLLLNADGSRPDADAGVFLDLVQATDAPPAKTLADHTWSLVAANAADGSRIDALFPEAARPFSLAFAEGRLHATGGCNGLRARYELTPEGGFSVSGAAATMMACEAPLMAADAALSGLFSAPLEFALVQGQSPTLALIASTGEVLLFRGELTHEARLGPGTTVFYEVGPRRLPCDEATSTDGLCLQIREITFDAQGLRVGEPGAFMPFGGGIEGYEHTEGTRNVLRVKRFGSAQTSGEGVMVLDLVVESESVPQ
jgi:heat shock protein HslJ